MKQVVKVSKQWLVFRINMLLIGTWFVFFYILLAMTDSLIHCSNHALSGGQ